MEKDKTEFYYTTWHDSNSWNPVKEDMSCYILMHMSYIFLFDPAEIGILNNLSMFDYIVKLESI